MPVIDDLLAKLGESRLDAASRSILATFLQDHRAALEGLGPEFLRTIAGALLAGQPADWDALVGTLDQRQLLALLESTGPEMAAAAGRRAQAVARLEALGASLEDAALRLIAHLLLALL